MTINYESLLNIEIPTVTQTYTEKDTILYALSVGLGYDPSDPQQLEFVYEKNLKAVPSLPVVLAHPGMWVRYLDTGIDYGKVVHGEQALIIHKPIPASATVRGETNVTAVVDKGKGRGSLVYYQRRIYDVTNNDLLATVKHTMFCRGDGGFGGPTVSVTTPNQLPSRKPDLICDLPTMPQSALLYRLNADMNPLHADLDVAAIAGFPRPILHGLATYGVAVHAVLKCVCDYDPTRLTSFDCRFTSPVFPGETLRTEIWLEGSYISFQTRALERDIIIISNGRAEI